MEEKIKKYERYVFQKYDWECLRKLIYGLTFETTKKICTIKEMKEVFERLPEYIKEDAYLGGFIETFWKDLFIEWAEENMWVIPE